MPDPNLDQQKLDTQARLTSLYAGETTAPEPEAEPPEQTIGDQLEQILENGERVDHEHLDALTGTQNPTHDPLIAAYNAAGRKR